MFYAWLIHVDKCGNPLRILRCCLLFLQNPRSWCLCAQSSTAWFMTYRRAKILSLDGVHKKFLVDCKSNWPQESHTSQWCLAAVPHGFETLRHPARITLLSPITVSSHEWLHTSPQSFVCYWRVFGRADCCKIISSGEKTEQIIEASRDE